MFTWRLPCPHCNGPNDVALDRHCLTCVYCGAGLWVRYPDAYPTVAAAPRVEWREALFHWDHYLKERHRPLSRPGSRAVLVFFPFWHINAIVAIPRTHASDSPDVDRFCFPVASDSWTCVQSPTQRRKQDDGEGPWEIKPWDLSFPAFDPGLCGLDSLGVRVQTVPLSGCSGSGAPDSTRWWPHNGQPQEAISRLSDSVNSLLAQTGRPKSEPPRIIAPRVSLIFWPVWILLGSGSDSPAFAEIDAVSGQVIRERDSNNRLPEVDNADPGEPPRLLPHRCPSCGADLPVDGTLTVFPCTNCGVLVAHSGNGDRRTTSCEFSNDASKRTSQWYPFWVFEPDQTMVPAFPIRNLRALVRFGFIVSGQGRKFACPIDPPTKLAGVSLLPEVAAGLGALICEQKSDSSPQLVPTNPRLVFIPLESHLGELSDPATGLCLPRAALAPLQ